ncbi:MAG TPA: ATP-binding protein [Gemmatimonadales bacterium]|nr:ATP-binding protein [Gemmatimonadales bacterium]
MTRLDPGRAVRITAALVALHSLSVLGGWWAGLPLFVSPPENFTPMVPTAAICFGLVALALMASRPSRPWVGRARLAAVGVVAIVALLSLAFPTRLDALLGGAIGSSGRVPLGAMTPITSAAMLMLAGGVGLIGRLNATAAMLSTGSAIVGAIVTLGYMYGTPLLFGSTITPVTLPSGLSFLLLGAAAAASCGPEVWPLRPLAGDSPRAQMLRAFLPATALLLVLGGLVDFRMTRALGVNPALVAGWLAVVMVVLITLIVSHQARRTGTKLDEAYSARYRAEQQYREIFEQSLAGVATWSEDGRIQLCNEAFARMLGYDTADELQRLSAGSLYWDPQDQIRMMAELRESGTLRNTELRLRGKDGKLVWVLASFILHVGDREPRVESMVIDISTRKELEQQLWHAQKMDALGRLAGGVAHDFNNLLTVIGGCTELLRATLPPDGPHVTELDEIEKAHQRAAALTRQLLAFSRRLPFEPRALALDAVVRDMQGTLRRLLGPEIRLDLVSEDRLPPVWADQSQLEQIVLNLVVNARDAMPRGGKLTIETRSVPDHDPASFGQNLPAGAYVMLAVTDTGTGMDAATLERIFEPFFTTKEKGKGTGLGLATVYGVVSQSHGHITVESAPGRGTTFRVWLPVTGETVMAEAPRAAPKHAQGREVVLVVEDEPAIMSLVVGALERSGYQVLPAVDGDAAMAIAAANPGRIHLVLTDGMLSGVRVPELLRRLKTDQPDTKVLLMSGYSHEEVFKDEAIDPGTAFLPKPFTLQQLRAKVREVLDS